MLSAPAIHSWFATQDWETDPAAAGWDQHRRARWVWRKYRKARRWARVLARVPGVRMIAIGNALGYGNCRDDSDIDLVIVTAPGRIWTARLLVVALLKLFRQRPGEHARDALCPSFFLTTDTLNLESLQLLCHPESRVNKQQHLRAVARDEAGEAMSSPRDRRTHSATRDPVHLQHAAGEISRSARNDTRGPPLDPYLLFWPTQLTILYDRDGTYAKFWDANAAWVCRWLPNATPRSTHSRFFRQKPLTQFCTAVQNCVMGFLHPVAPLVERLARRVQEPRLRRLFPHANTDTSVIIRDDMLKFHANDRRAEFRERWVARVEVKSEESKK